MDDKIDFGGVIVPIRSDENDIVITGRNFTFVNFDIKDNTQQGCGKFNQSISK